WRGGGSGQAARQHSHRGISIYPSAGHAWRRAVEFAPEQSAFVSESQIGDCGGIACGGGAAIAAAAKSECRAGFLFAKSRAGIAGGRRASGFFHGYRSRFCAERTNKQWQNIGTAGES